MPAFCRSRWGQGALALVLLLISLRMLDGLFPPPLDNAGRAGVVVTDRFGTPLHHFTDGDGRWRFGVALEDIDPDFIDHLLRIEDKRFYAHPGIDPLALSRAIVDVVRQGEVRSGASTITMQTARLLAPRERTIKAKLIEMIRAVQIEWRCSKQEILTLYLNLTPYGGNLQGVRAASLAYFDKEPVRLSLSEQALLIALPQAPEARRPDRRVAAAKKARQTVLDKLSASGAITVEAAAEAGQSYLPRQRHLFARHAYHASTQARAAALSRDDQSASLSLTLDRSLQTLLEDYAARQFRLDEPTTLSILVLDHREMAYRAIVGSGSLKTAGGWIDLTRAVRSPGSTLKPFIYGLAFEDGVLRADAVIDDMPRSFGGGYTPENFDRTFRGEVRIREALQHSLNLPAVATLEQVGAERFAAILKGAGAALESRRTAKGEASLAIALGGAGLRSRDLAVLYAGLANGGLVQPIKLWNDDAQLSGAFRLFSNDAALRIGHILRTAPSLKGRAPSMLTQAPKVAFKTGTSYGYRDAWAAGFAGRYTVVVWVGRADGASRPGETGRKAAAPILMDVFDLLARWDRQGFPDPVPVEDAVPMVSAKASAANKKPVIPDIVFPNNGSELFVDPQSGRGVRLSARGGTAGYHWYVNGAPLPLDASSGQPVWYPLTEGFYDIKVVDDRGAMDHTNVRVRFSHG